MNKLKDTVYRVSFVSIIVNVVLSTFKLIAGIVGNSKAMISDSIHSLSDVISTIVVIIGIYISRKSPDKKHPYGHERFECLSAIILSVVLGITGFYIGYFGILNIINKSYVNDSISVIALIAAITSIVVKEWMYHYTIKAAKKVNSDALKADAWHHRSDALSSVGALVGIFGSMIGFKILDPIASIVISLCIIKAAYDILRDSFNKMMDVSVPTLLEDDIKRIVMSVDGVIKIDDLKTRLFGSKIFIDIEIMVDGDLNLRSAHSIAHLVHDKVENEIKDCKHCMVHVNPD